MITIALPKGRLADKTIELLEKAGVERSPLKIDTRKLVLFDASGKYKFIFVKPVDVPTYVERGAADIGVAGKDTLNEEEKDVYEMLDLSFGRCRMCVAGFREKKDYITVNTLRVATKYPNTAKKYYRAKGVNIDLIRLSGSVELAPVIDLCDVIVDIVESGKTLEANNLTVLDEIAQISARLAVNKSALKTKPEIKELIEKLSKALEKVKQ